ncbi:MAG: manganese efflux pump [Lachnospiraceae bacterium]|nr:manganese efflux pump [Lachnospiraceae bacterium]
MGLIELLLLGIGLSMDAFAVSICKGIETKKANIRQIMTCGIWFGLFQGLMPFIGYVLGSRLEFIINKVAPWLAFVLLSIIGVNMIREAFSSEEEETRSGFDVKSMFILAVATSIDALAVGITFVAVPVTLINSTALMNTIIGCLIIMATTFSFSCLGVRIGNVFGTRFKSGAEAVGGFVLVFIGLKILMEHLGVLEFMGNGDVLFGLLIPLLGIVLGSALVFATDSVIREDFMLVMMGMAGGIMLACSMWTLLYPSIIQGKVLTAAVGFIIGVGFQYLLDKAVPHTHAFTKAEEGPACSLKFSLKVMLSEVIHHAPEGMAIGLVFAGALNGADEISLTTAFVLAAGIAVQNIPEAIFVSNPIRSGGEEKGKSFLMGVLSGIIEPLLGIAMIIIVTAFPGILQFLMALTGGAIAFLVLEENIPAMCTGEHSDKGTISFAVFFCLMMVITFSAGI